MLCYAQIVHTLLGQVDPTKAIADGLSGGTLTQALGYACAMLVIALIAVCKLFWDSIQKSAADREGRERAHDVELATLQKAKDEEISALQADRLARVSAAAEAQQALLLKVLPLQNQLAEMIKLTSRE